MAWVYIGDLRFRNPLPNMGKTRCFPNQDITSSSDGNKRKDELLLLQGNIPSCYQWRKGEDVDMNDGGNDNDKNNSSSHRKKGKNNESEDWWTHKETSCDVEFDTIGT